LLPIAPVFEQNTGLCRIVLNEVSSEERTRIRQNLMHGITRRLARLEARYRLAGQSAGSCNPRSNKGDTDFNREGIFKCFRRINFTEIQIDSLISSVADVSHGMQFSRTSKINRRSEGDVRNLDELESPYLTDIGELRKILALVRKSKADMLEAKDQFVRSNLRLVISIAESTHILDWIPWIYSRKAVSGL